MKKKRKMLKVSKKQSGKTKNKQADKADKARKAMKPGLRQSDTGKKYWETRKNRSDINPKKRL